MTDKQETNDEIRAISLKFQSITTTEREPNLNQNDHYPQNDQAMPKVKNTPTSNSTQDRKKNKFCTVNDSWMTNDLPGINLPERITFVVDTAREPDCTQFETRTGGKYTPLSMIKRVIEIFVNIKLGIYNKHEFAIMTLDADSVSWICDFTNNRKTFLSYLDKIEESHPEEDQDLCDLGPCFEKIYRNSDLERIDNVATHVERVILIYGRSHSIPQFITGRNYFDLLSQDSHFFFDSLYVHEPLSEQNECQAVYAKLGTLDTKQTSFILEAARNPATLHTNMAKLTAHPLQRARQDNTPYSVYNNPGSPSEVQTNV